MEPTTQTLVRFIKAPAYHARSQSEMRQALAGVMFKATPRPNCFVTATKNLLGAVQAQRSFSVYSYWDTVLNQSPGEIFIGRSECEAVDRFKLEIIAPLPITSLRKKVRRACMGMQINLDTEDFDLQKNGFYVSLLKTLFQLEWHNNGTFMRYVENQPALRIIGKLFLPAHTCKVLSTTY